MRKILASVWRGSQGRVVAPSEPPDEHRSWQGSRGLVVNFFFFPFEVLVRNPSKNVESAMEVTGDPNGSPFGGKVVSEVRQKREKRTHGEDAGEEVGSRESSDSQDRAVVRAKGRFRKGALAGAL